MLEVLCLITFLISRKGAESAKISCLKSISQNILHSPRNALSLFKTVCVWVPFLMDRFVLDGTIEWIVFILR